MIGIYVRVSSKSQRHDSQERELRRWLQSNGHDPDEVTWYRDTETGRTLARPAFERLQADIFAGTVKTVVVWKLDRLSRRQRDGINLLADWCDRGIRVISVTQQIDMNGAMGRMLASVMLGLAEIELETRRERQMAGIAAARSRGIYNGRKPGSTKAKPDRVALV